MSGDGGETLGLAVVFLVVALVYASVGQAGASGYIAAMGLLGMAPLTMKTTALALNLLVAGIGTLQFWRMGIPVVAGGLSVRHPGLSIFSDRRGDPAPRTLLLPVCRHSPTAVGGADAPIRPQEERRTPNTDPPTRPSFPPADWGDYWLGLGNDRHRGRRFLAPIILGMNWATVRQTAATTAVYNLMNSAAALLGAHRYWDQIPPAMPLWLCAVGLGGGLGAFVGSRYLPETWMRYILALLLFVSGLKLVMS